MHLERRTRIGHGSGHVWRPAESVATLRFMPGWVSPWELLILLAFVLLLFGPKRLPEMGRSLGKGMREFKESLTGKDDDEPKQELPPPAPAAEQEPVASATQREPDSR